MSDVHFVNEQAALDYQCAICLQIIDSPVIVTTCNKHIFCGQCIQRLIDEDDRKDWIVHKCPSCRQSFHSYQVQQVGFIQYQINKLQVYCNNHQNVASCSWIGNYKDLKTHMEHCAYNVVECDLCGQLCIAKSLIQHKTLHQQVKEKKMHMAILRNKVNAMKKRFEKLESSERDLKQKINTSLSAFD
eukprot:454811_1